MDNIINFVMDNIIYVAGIGLILIIILIGFISSRRKKKNNGGEEKNTMANLNEVSTGEISQVADVVKQNEMKPVDVAPVVGPTTDALKVEVGPVTPVIADTTRPIEELSPVAPVVNPTTVPLPQDNSEKFDKTEVIDFSDINGPKANPTVNNTEVVGDNMLNGEEPRTQENDQTPTL